LIPKPLIEASDPVDQCTSVCDSQWRGYVPAEEMPVMEDRHPCPDPGAACSIVTHPVIAENEHVGAIA
jgi:hypothetical protein